MSTYDNISLIYEKWSSGDAAYVDSGKFYVSVLNQMTYGHYLELGIGTGRISIMAIKSTPISITGIDISSEMLKVCQRKYEKLTERKGTLQLCRRDFSKLTYYEDFEGAIMPFRTIGHLLTPSAVQSLFSSVYSALKPGGWFLLDHYMFNRTWAETHNNVKIIMYQDAEMTIWDCYQYDFQNKIMHCKVIVNDVLFENFDFRWIEPQEIELNAKQVGFEVLLRMGEFDGSMWNSNSYEQIWLLRKPGDSIPPIKLPQFN